MENLIGQTLNRYKIVSLLGEGGMGAVFSVFIFCSSRVVAALAAARSSGNSGTASIGPPTPPGHWSDC